MSSSSFSKPKPFSVVYLGEEHCDPPLFLNLEMYPILKKIKGTFCVQILN